MPTIRNYVGDPQTNASFDVLFPEYIKCSTFKRGDENILRLRYRRTITEFALPKGKFWGQDLVHATIADFLATATR